MTAALHITIIGYLLVLLALMHAAFPARFKWKTEFASLTLLSRQIMYVHTFFVALFVLLNGLLFIFCADDLVAVSHLSTIVIAGLFIFWFCRMVFQHIVYARELWLGKKFETAVHIVFSMIWLYISIVLGYVLYLHLF